MHTIAADKRCRSLNERLSEILRQYLIAWDSLHNNPLADIEDNLLQIQMVVLQCRHIILDYKWDHKGEG